MFFFQKTNFFILDNNVDRVGSKRRQRNRGACNITINCGGIQGTRRRSVRRESRLIPLVSFYFSNWCCGEIN